MENIKIISLGGSIIAPDKVDTDFLKAFRSEILKYLEADNTRKLILVTGGGGPARSYQSACREINSEADSSAQDWVGIAATRLNGQLMKAVFDGLCLDDVVTDPTSVKEIKGRIMIAAGWKPGWSTDYDAVVLAQNLGADTVINLSNISKVYSDDPKLNPEATAFDKMSWDQLKKLVGDSWVPGKNVPFDPIATKLGAEIGLKVVTAAGKDIPNLVAVLEGRDFEGTMIGPE